MQPLRIALAQVAPRLGDLEANLDRHAEVIREAKAGGAALVVFPELGLTGYLPQDLAAEAALRRDDPRLAALAGETAGCSAIVSFVEESADHRLFIAAALLEDGALRHVQRKVHLPTYGLFDERRFFAPGDSIRAVPSRLGVGIGLAICEDFWHLGTAQVLALDGAQVLVNVSSSPGRDLAASHAEGLGTAASSRAFLRTYAQLTTSVVVFCNRVGVDESISFWGGSEVIGPGGETLVQALAAWVFEASARERLSAVAMGGGCFVNAILSEGLRRELRAGDLTVLEARQAPANDGGIALGQAWVAMQENP